MNISKIQQSFQIEASRIKVTKTLDTGEIVTVGYQELSKRELANGYCDAEEAGNEVLRSAYYGALMLRYWYKIFEWYQSCKSLRLEMEDYILWLDDCLRDALYYRSWRPTRQIEKDEHGKFIGPYVTNPQYRPDDPDAADRSINYFCGAKRGKEYQAFNKDKRKANAQTISLDTSVDENGDCMLQYAGAYEDAKQLDSINFLIKKLLADKQLIEAIIVDGISHFDSYKTTKETVAVTEVDENGVEYKVTQNRYSTEFNKRKLVKHLNSLNDSFIKYFHTTYGLNINKTKELVAEIQKLPNVKLYKYIEKTLIQLKNPELLRFLI